MEKKWTLGNLFRNDEEESGERMEKTLSSEVENEHTPGEDIPVEDIVYLPEIKGSVLQLWKLWAGEETPPLLQLIVSKNAQNRDLAMQRLERERVRLIVQLEQDAKKRLQQMEKGKALGHFSLDSSCHVYISKDKMLAWALFFPPIGPEGKFEAGAMGNALQMARVTTGIDSNKVIRVLQDPRYFELIPIAEGTEPVEGSNGKLIELFTREATKEVVIDLDGKADYRALNYVRQISENERICNIIPPKEGTPGVQVDGKVINPKAVKAAKVPKGINTVISEDGRYLVAERNGHLEFANGLFHVRPVLEVKGDVDYSTGNIEFDGDIHVYGDVREGFEVRATGTVTIDGLVEGATVETGGDLVISRGVVGDHRALLRSKGNVRVKYLENCVLYAGKTVYADCVMTSQVFSDDAINVTSGRGSVIGGNMTAAHSICAKVVGAQSGRRTELTLGALPYVQTELQTIEEEISVLRTEIERIDRDLAFLEAAGGLNGSNPKLGKVRMRRSVLSMQEKKLVARQQSLAPMHPDLSKCRFEANAVYPVTALKIQNRVWVAREIRRRCRLVYDEANKEIKEVQ